jgi:phospholipase C
MPADPEIIGGACVAPFPIANNGADFDHSHTTFENQYRDGRNDGFIASFRQRGEDGSLAMGYYTEEDIPFSYAAARDFVLFDRFFTSASAGSIPNRLFWTTGTADPGRRLAGLADHFRSPPGTGRLVEVLRREL